MEKYIHFYESEENAPRRKTYFGWKETEAAIRECEPNIVTTQMGLMSFDLVEQGYRIFVHEPDGSSYELSYEKPCERTEKELRRPHNVFHMWKAGAFARRDTLTSQE